jgi:Ca2+-binding EF-hand superfamily protein
LSEFSKVVSEHAFEWTAAQIKTVFDFFDKDKTGSISYEEFLQGLRGDLNERRKQLVYLAFEVLNNQYFLCFDC